MKIFTRFVIISFVLMIIVPQVKLQEFYEDGSMKLTEISTDKTYGYEAKPKTSIKVGKIENQQAYLRALRGPNGEEVRFRRLSSCCKFKSKSAAFGNGFLDKYEVYYQGLKEPVILYLNGYEFETPKSPAGFTFVTAGNIEKPLIYEKDRILKVEFCDSLAKFAVKESLLQAKVGELPEPEATPAFRGGKDALKSYFTDRPLVDPRALNKVFMVSIAFLVDCNGHAGNFMIITKGKGLMETLANQILEKVNEMPQEWMPATANGENVDCYQVLYFTVEDGQLGRVSYR